MGTQQTDDVFAASVAIASTAMYTYAWEFQEPLVCLADLLAELVSGLEQASLCCSTCPAHCRAQVGNVSQALQKPVCVNIPQSEQESSDLSNNSPAFPLRWDLRMLQSSPIRGDTLLDKPRLQHKLCTQPLFLGNLRPSATVFLASI